MTKAKTLHPVITIGYGSNPKTTPVAKREPGSLADVRALVRVLDALAIDLLVDARAFAGPATAPAADSKKPIYVRQGFRRYQLSALLGERYDWQGDRLGGLHGPSGGPTEAGIGSIVADYRMGRRLAVMCSEAGPWDCHRHWTIATRSPIDPNGDPLPKGPKGLIERGVQVLHYFDARALADEPKASRMEQLIPAHGMEQFRRGKRKDYDVHPFEEFVVNKEALR